MSYYGNDLLIPGQKTAPDVRDRTLIPVRAKPKRLPRGGNKRPCTPVVELEAGKVMKEYSSVVAAAGAHYLSESAFRNRIHRGIRVGGRSWAYKQPVE